MVPIGKTSLSRVLIVVLFLAGTGLFFAVLPGPVEEAAEPLRIHETEAVPLTMLALSESGNAFATGSANGHVVVRSLPARRARPVGPATGSPLTMLTWSPDGLLLSGDASGLLRGWEQPELNVTPIESPRIPVTCVAFRRKLVRREILLGLADGRIVTIGEETTLHDSGHRGVKAMLLNTDHSTLVTAGTEGAIVWYDLEDDRILKQVDAHATEISSLAWSPDRELLVSADWNGDIQVRDASTRKQTVSASQADAVSDLAWSGEQLVTGSWDGRLRVWEVTSDSLQLVDSINTGRPVHSLIALPDEPVIVTASGDALIREWRLSGTEATGDSGRAK